MCGWMQDFFSHFVRFIFGRPNGAEPGVAAQHPPGTLSALAGVVSFSSSFSVVMINWGEDWRSDRPPSVASAFIYQAKV